MEIVDNLGFASDEIKRKYPEGNARRLLGL